MKLRGSSKYLPLLAALAVALFSGCGKASKFAKQEFNAVNVAGQYIRPKIDILVFQDNSASMTQPIQNLKGQFDSFVSGVDSRWDFHFTVLPLQSQMSLNSKYIIAQNCNEVTAGTCLPPSSASGFSSYPGTDYGWIQTINTSTANKDLGFNNMQANLSQPLMANSGFLRPDAALAVVVVTNGEDVSGISYPADYLDTDGDGTYSEINYNSPNAAASFNGFKSYLESLKGGSSLVRFYSVVAKNMYKMQYCYGNPGQGYTFRGQRYMDMSIALNSKHYELCSGELNGVLGNIASQLNSMIQAYIFNYAILENGEPVESSIQVFKNDVPVPKSSVNGWEYVGYVDGQYMSYFPQLSNRRTGYFIKLNGSYEYRGTDKINITYQKK